MNCSNRALILPEAINHYREIENIFSKLSYLFLEKRDANYGERYDTTFESRFATYQSTNNPGNITFSGEGICL